MIFILTGSLKELSGNTIRIEICDMSRNISNDTLCSSILRVNKNVQFVTLINKQGRPIDVVSRPGFKIPFQNPLSEMFFMQCILQVSMGRDFDKYYGLAVYYMCQREDVTILSFPLDDDVLLIMASDTVNSVLLARKIINKIASFKKQSAQI